MMFLKGEHRDPGQVLNPRVLASLSLVEAGATVIVRPIHN
jgi:hypothetical protein